MDDEGFGIVGELDLPDWWIGAGFVRSKIWNHLHGYQERTELPDVDVIYYEVRDEADLFAEAHFDRTDFSEEESQNDSTVKEEHYRKLLKEKIPDIKWSVTNQARMHLFHNHPPYKNSEEALSKWVETATCIGVKLDENDQLILTAPHGIDDLVNLILRPVPNSYQDLTAFYDRINQKHWLQKWPKLKIIAG